MTTFSKTDFVCRICDNNVDNLEFLAVEMLFGTKDEFKYVECSKCKCIQIKNIPQNLAKYYPKDYNSFDPVLKIYDSIIKKYFKKIMAKDYLENNLNVFTKLLFNLFGAGFLEKIKPTKINFNSSILDIGSGNGLRLVGLARYGFQNITGIDPFIDKDIEYENGIKIYKKDLMDIDGQFDMIMLNHSYEHMTNPEEVLIKAKTLLKNNGVLLIRIPISNSFSWKKYGTNWVALDPPRHIYLHNQQTIDILAKRTGFELAHILYDSTEYQFVGSEQYIRGIPMFSNKSYYRNKENSIFTEDQIRSYKEKAKKLNKSSKGDMACFYLKKSKENY